MPAGIDGRLTLEKGPQYQINLEVDTIQLDGKHKPEATLDNSPPAAVPLYKSPTRNVGATQNVGL